jgi:hypothetical protein
MTSDAQLGLRRKRKLSPRAWIGFLIGYTSSNSYRVWHPLKNEVFTIRDVIFNEKQHFDGSLESLADEIRELDLQDIQRRIEELIRASKDLKVTQDADEEADEIDLHPETPQSVQRDDIYTKAFFVPLPTPPQSPPAGFFTELGVGGGDNIESSAGQDCREGPTSQQPPMMRVTPRTSWKAAFLAGAQRPRKRLEDDLQRLYARSGQPHTSLTGRVPRKLQQEYVGPTGICLSLQQRQSAGERKPRVDELPVVVGLRRDAECS